MVTTSSFLPLTLQIVCLGLGYKRSFRNAYKLFLFLYPVIFMKPVRKHISNSVFALLLIIYINIESKPKLYLWKLFYFLCIVYTNDIDIDSEYLICCQFKEVLNIHTVCTRKLPSMHTPSMLLYVLYNLHDKW